MKKLMANYDLIDEILKKIGVLKKARTPPTLNRLEESFPVTWCGVAARAHLGCHHPLLLIILIALG